MGQENNLKSGSWKLVWLELNEALEKLPKYTVGTLWCFVPLGDPGSFAGTSLYFLLFLWCLHQHFSKSYLKNVKVALRSTRLLYLRKSHKFRSCLQNEGVSIWSQCHSIYPWQNKIATKSNFPKNEAIQSKLYLLKYLFIFNYSLQWHEFDKLDSLEKANVLIFQVKGLAVNWSCF